MAKRTRVFLLVAAAVLAGGLATGFAAWRMGAPLLAALGSSAPGELAYVPDGVRLVAYADVRQVMNSQLHDRLRRLQRDRPSNTDGLEARTGINMETDVDHVVLAVSGAPGADRSLLVARGRFNQVRIEGLMRDQGAEVGQYRGKRLVSIKGAPRDIALAFAEPGLIIFGDAATVREAIDTKAGAGGNITANREFMQFVDEVDGETAWTVAKFDAVVGRTPLPPAVASQLPPINWLAASGRVEGDVRGLVRAQTRDEESARNLRDVVRGFLTLARIQGSQPPALKGVLDSVQLGGEGKTVSLTFELTPDALDFLSSPGSVPAPPAPRRPTRPQGSPQIF